MLEHAIGDTPSKWPLAALIELRLAVLNAFCQLGSAIYHFCEEIDSRRCYHQRPQVNAKL